MFFPTVGECTFNNTFNHLLNKSYFKIHNQKMRQVQIFIMRHWKLTMFDYSKVQRLKYCGYDVLAIKIILKVKILNWGLVSKVFWFVKFSRITLRRSIWQLIWKHLRVVVCQICNSYFYTANIKSFKNARTTIVEAA
jgi:hypothetical protein